MKREDLHWIIPLLEKLRDNPDAQLFHYGKTANLEYIQFVSGKDSYSVHIQRKYRLYTRSCGNVFCVTNDASKLPAVERDITIEWLTDWLPVPAGP